MMLRANRMLPSGPHVPPRELDAVVTTCTAPLAISSVCSLPSAKKPTDRLSGDQKGDEASSAPARGSADTESSDRNQRRDRPSVVATNATLRPSGEMASENGSKVDGVRMSSRISGVAENGRSSNASAMLNAIAN